MYQRFPFSTFIPFSAFKQLSTTQTTFLYENSHIFFPYSPKDSKKPHNQPHSQDIQNLPWTPSKSMSAPLSSSNPFDNLQDLTEHLCPPQTSRCDKFKGLEAMLQTTRRNLAAAQERTKRVADTIATQRSRYEASSKTLRESIEFTSSNLPYFDRLENALLDTQDPEHAALLEESYAAGYTPDEISQMVKGTKRLLEKTYLDLPDIEDKLRKKADDIEGMEKELIEMVAHEKKIVEVMERCEKFLAKETKKKSK